MKRLFLACSCLFIWVSGMHAQTVTFNTQTLGTGFSGNNGSSGISFVIQNTNPYAAVLTSVSNFFTTGGTGNFTLWYSATSLSGGPITLSSPTWNPIQSINGVVIGSGTQSVLFPLLAFVIPGNTTYRFYIQETAGPVFTYTGLTNPTGVSPLIFTNSGVSLIVGEYLIGGQIVGWGGLVNNPRAFTGSVTLNLLSSPCTGQPTAGFAQAVPNNPCPGIPVTLSLTGTTAASGLTYQWQRSSSPTGPWTTAGLTTATTNPSFYTPPAGSTTFYRCIVTCTNSGLVDTSNVTGAVVVQPFSPTSPCYCTTTNAGSACITNVTMGTLNNTTPGCTGTGNYNFYTALPVPNFTIGSPVTFTMTTDASAITSVWIDYNHNTVFDSSEWHQIYTAGLNGSITFTIPSTALVGQTRMRVRSRLTGNQNGPLDACLTMGSGETEDYIINLQASGPYDPMLSLLNAPVGNICTDSNMTLSAEILNFGSTNINTTLHPITVTFHVTGPSGTVNYTASVPSGTTAPNLPAFGASPLIYSVSGVNMYAGGTYQINATVSCPSLTNANLTNDSLSNPIVITNYRPTAGPDYQLCQYSSIPFGQGLTVGGCSAPLLDSVTLNFVITGPCMDNIGATGTGTSAGPPANCADQYACAFAHSTIPSLPSGSSFYTDAILRVTNLATLSSSFGSEVRMNLYGTVPTGSSLYSPGAAGSTLAGSSNFTYQRGVSPLQLSNMFSGLAAGATLNMGYWESWNDLFNASDISINAGGNPTVATLTIYYQYVPPAFAWYDVPSGGTSLYTLSPFNPLAYPNAVVNNSNVTGLFTFYAACLGLPTCRVPVHLKVNPTPAACQDTLWACEYAPGANNALILLDTLKSKVSCFNAAASVHFYGDQSLLIQLDTNAVGVPDTLSSGIFYSKVYYAATGCYSSDTVLFNVNSIPQFSLPIYTGFACAPGAIDISSLINVFPTSGNDTAYYDNPAYTLPYTGNPHNITSADTLYMIVHTNGPVVCADSATAYIDVIPATNNIANQDPLNFSICGSVPCGNINLSNGNTLTLYTTSDCKRIATVTDDPTDPVNLGITQICEDVACSVPVYNGQPYLNRVYEITPTNDGKATVCLYYLQQDIDDYNAAAFSSWPTMAADTNLTISEVHNGPIGNPGSTVTVIPNSAITATYDNLTTVWTICFHVDTFSYFYAHTANPLGAALPVSLLSFSGRKEGATSQLSWVTASEQNNQYFILERSMDGKHFIAISEPIPSKSVNGNSQSPLSYTYTDQHPLPGHNEYRLRQVDWSNTSHESGTVDLYFAEPGLIQVYPNPVSSDLQIDMDMSGSGHADILLRDMTGKLVYQISMPVNAGSNHTSVDLSQLADGLYTLQIIDQQGLRYEKVIRKK